MAALNKTFAEPYPHKVAMPSQMAGVDQIPRRRDGAVLHDRTDGRQDAALGFDSIGLRSRLTHLSCRNRLIHAQRRRIRVIRATPAIRALQRTRAILAQRRIRATHATRVL